MISMQEIRAKYPQYNDMADDQLANALHQKYYSDMPVEQFYQKIGFSTPQQDVPREPMPAQNQVPVNWLIDPIKVPAQAFTSGIKRGLTGLAQLGAYPIDKLAGTDLREQLQASQQAKDKAFDEQMAPYGMAPKALRFAGEIAPGIVGGEAAAIPKLVGAALKNAPRGAQIAGDIAGNVGLGALLGAGTYTPELESMAKKAALGGAFGLIPGAVTGIKSIPWTKMLGTNIAKEDIPRVMEALGDSKTSLGDAFNSPLLKKVQENVLANVPFGGVNKTYGKVAQGLEKEGEGIFGSLTGGQDVPEDLAQHFVDELSAAKQTARNTKNAAYNVANKEAEKAGLSITPTNYQKTAQELLGQSASKDFPELADTGLQSFLEKAATEKPAQSFKDFNLVRGLLNKEIKKASMAGEDNQVNALKSLREAIDADRNLAIESSGNEKIKKLFSEAQETYASTYAPFKEGEIARFLNKKADPDTLVDYFLRTGKTDRPKLAAKLLNKLPEKTRDLVAYKYFSRAFKENLGTGSLDFDPRTFMGLWKKIGPKTREVVIKDPTMRRNIENYVMKAERNPEALNMMANPKTGARNALTLGSYLPALGAGALGGPIGGLSLLASMAGGTRVANKILTSPSVRRKIANKLVSPKKELRTGGKTRVSLLELLNQIGQ